ncbi:hypothetical protein [Hyphomicrobium sp. CS1BSMeth3]|uniref:hypothetical protein n=1 Tax=Hyphomicrobium sp. CS1BSMeth3 TaxID=1892844 RepID=UPI00092FDE45|nr:hypothetical protein [Hyphomicrobium sp. CS1BSMeth3]
MIPLMSSEDMTPTIFCTRTKRVIDVCKGDADAVADRLQSLTRDYGPDLVVLAWDDAWQRMEAAAKTEPVEINEEAWDYALSVLPPLGWRNDGSRESFKVCEPVLGTLVSIYVRLGDRRFTFIDSARLRHDECCGRVAASRAFLDDPAEDKAAEPLPEPQETPAGYAWPSSSDKGR